MRNYNKIVTMCVWGGGRGEFNSALGASLFVNHRSSLCKLPRITTRCFTA